MALQAAFLFLIGDADETTRTVVSTPSIHLNVVGCKTYAEAEAAAKELAAGCRSGRGSADAPWTRRFCSTHTHPGQWPAD